MCMNMYEYKIMRSMKMCERRTEQKVEEEVDRDQDRETVSNQDFKILESMRSEATKEV